MKPIRVVFDTNIVLSALVLKSSRLAWLRAHWQNSMCNPLVSQATAAELVRVLAYPKFRLSQEDCEELLAEYLPYCEIVTPRRRCRIACRDPKDQPFLDLAYAAEAKVLITGDRDLLALSSSVPFAIETPESYRLRFEPS